MLPLREGCEERCPGCSHRSLTAPESHTQKEKWLSQILTDLPLEPLRAPFSESGRWNYREKTCLAAFWNGEGWDLGLKRTKRWGPPFGKGSRQYEVVPIPGCPVHSARIREAVEKLSRLLPAALPLSFVAMTGGLLTLVLKINPPSGEETALEASLKMLLRDLDFDGVYLNYHAASGKRVFSSKGWKLLLGSPTSRRHGVVHGPESFQQLIPELYENALNEVLGHLQPTEKDFVLDLYCGLGISLRQWASKGARSVGVELVGEAVRLAKEAEPRAIIFRGRVSERIPQLDECIADWRSEKTGGKLLVFTNPPRTGMESEVLIWLRERVKPAKISYLSCSVGTLARDLSVLSAYGVRRIIPYDFFPQTHHVEALACLELDSDRADAPLIIQ